MLWRLRRLLARPRAACLPLRPFDDPEPPLAEALVPLGPPRRPRPFLAAVLPLPEPPVDLDAYAGS